MPTQKTLMPQRPAFRASAAAVIVVLTAAWSETANAQTSADEDVVYDAAYFAQFRPQTAYDIVLVTPGFALEEMSAARGLTASSGNVLVDGKRPNAKSGGLKEVLSRTPAAMVARVEVSRGVPGSGEAAGQSLVLNVVRSRVRSRGSWSVQLERPSDPDANVAADLSFAHSVGEWETNSKVQGLWRRRNYTYYHRHTVGADGALRQFQEEDAPSLTGEAFLSTEAKRSLGTGVLTLTGRLGRDVWFRDRNRTNFDSDAPGASPRSRQRIGDDLARLTAEGGAEWVRAKPAGWTLKLAALSSWTDTEGDQNSQSGPFGAPPQLISSFLNDEKAFEAIGSVSAVRTGGGPVTPEIGLEIAFNRLDSVVTSGLSRGGLVVPDAASREHTIVEEMRGEGFANFKWAVSDRWKVEGGVAVEMSEISVGGDARNKQDLSFIKPTFAASYRLRDGALARMAIQRRVGQLDFTDFAASANLSDGRILAGNTQLRPDQVWRASVGVDLRSKRRGALSLEVYYEAIEDVLEQAILNDEGEIGLANLGSAERWGVTARGTLPLTRLLPGSRLELTLNWKDSQFDDPLTGETRTLTYFTPLTGNLGFRQDLEGAKVSWGGKALFREQDKWYFVDERTFRYRGATYSAFVETTRWLNLKMRVDLENIGARRNGDTREIYRPDRRSPLQSYQISRRADGLWTRLTVSRQF